MLSVGMLLIFSRFYLAPKIEEQSKINSNNETNGEVENEE